MQDGDLEYDPAELPGLLCPILDGTADVVYGSRYLRRTETGERKFRILRFGVMLLNWVVRSLYGVRLSDEATCYKVFRTDLLRRMDLQCERFEFCPEVTAKGCRLGARIVELPIGYSPRSYREGKKIRLRDGVEALWTLWRYRYWNASASAAVGTPEDEVENGLWNEWGDIIGLDHREMPKPEDAITSALKATSHVD